MDVDVQAQGQWVMNVDVQSQRKRYWMLTHSHREKVLDVDSGPVTNRASYA